MTYYELLKSNAGFIHLLKKNGVIIKDVEMVAIYEKYIQMSQSPDKRTYIFEKLADEAGITSRTLYAIIHRMESQITL